MYYLGILKESIENREAEEAKDSLLKEQEVLITNLKQQLLNPQNERKALSENSAIKTQISSLCDCLRKTKLEHSNLREQVCKMQTEYNLFITNITNQLRQYAEIITETTVSERNCSPELEENNGSIEFLSPASSDSEALFVPRQSSGDSFNPSPVNGIDRCSDGDAWPTKYRKYEKEKQQLIDKHNNALKRKDSMHKLQIDTIIRSLAKRHIRKPRPFLTPSPELFMMSNERLEQTEFLKNCFSKVKYSSDGGY